jgi:hypothetical protein
MFLIVDGIARSAHTSSKIRLITQADHMATTQAIQRYGIAIAVATVTGVVVHRVSRQLFNFSQGSSTPLAITAASGILLIFLSSRKGDAPLVHTPHVVKSFAEDSYPPALQKAWNAQPAALTQDVTITTRCPYGALEKEDDVFIAIEFGLGDRQKYLFKVDLINNNETGFKNLLHLRLACLRHEAAVDRIKCLSTGLNKDGWTILRSSGPANAAFLTKDGVKLQVTIGMDSVTLQIVQPEAKNTVKRPLYCSMFETWEESIARELRSLAGEG